MRSLQERSKICFDVSGIGAESLFGSSFAQAPRLKIVKELLAEIGNETLEPPADRCFVNVENTRNLQERLAIKEVRSEQKTVLRRKSLKSTDNGMLEASEFGANWHRRCLRGDIERVERSVTVGSAMVIYMPLGKDSAEPSEKRPAAGIRGQWRTALTIDLTKTIELRVKRVGEIVAESGGPGHGDGSLGKRSTVKAKEPLPCNLAAQSTGVREGKFREMQ